MTPAEEVAARLAAYDRWAAACVDLFTAVAVARAHGDRFPPEVTAALDAAEAARSDWRS